MALWVLFILYFITLSFLITRLSNKQVPISATEITFAFAFKVLAGCLYGYIHLRFYQGDDTWLYNAESREEYAKLVSQPLIFFGELWPSTIHSTASLLDYVFNNLERNLTVKLLACFHFLSRGNYYLNVIFFNFLLFWGHYWLFSFLTEKYPARRFVLIITVFFIPTVVFWLSGIRGDGLVFFFLSLLFIQFNRWLHRKSFFYLAASGGCLLGLFIFRSAVVLVLLPFLAGWFISVRFAMRPLPAFLVTYLFLALLFFGSRYLHPSFNLPAVVISKQHDFMALPGKTRFNMEPLQPDVISFLRAIPSALLNTLVRPFPWEVNGILQAVTSAETILFLIFILVSLPFVNYRHIISDPWICGMLFLSFSLFIFIGLTIPFPGAIIRYKCIPELLLMTSFVVTWKHINKILIRNN